MSVQVQVKPDASISSEEEKKENEYTMAKAIGQRKKGRRLKERKRQKREKEYMLANGWRGGKEKRRAKGGNGDRFGAIKMAPKKKRSKRQFESGRDSHRQDFF